MKLPTHIEERAGRLRFKPSPRLSKLGLGRENLLNADGTPMTKASEAMAWIESVLEPRIKAALAARDAKKKPAPAKPARREAGAKGVTLEEAFESFWHSVEFENCAPKTRQDYKAKGNWLAKFDPDLWGRRLDAIDRSTARGLWKAIKDGKRHPKAKLNSKKAWLYKPSLSMANGVLAVLRRLWSVSTDAKFVAGDNPFGKLKLKGTPPRVRVWTAEELRTMLAVADENDPETGSPRDPEMGDAIMLAHELGQRQADCLKLTWRDVDAEGRLLFTQNKTDARVPVRPPSELVARLEGAKGRRAALIKRLGQARVAPTIVVSRHKGGPIYKTACTHRFAELRTIAAKRLASCATLTFQDLRDTCVTNLADAGATTLQIASITGHSPASIENVLRHYHKATRAQSDGAMDLLRAYRDKVAA